MGILKSLASDTTYSKEMQRYYLACIDEFGNDFKQFVETLIMQTYLRAEVAKANRGVPVVHQKEVSDAHSV